VKQNVLAPGIAFNPNGGRVGRGDGFFDRFLFFNIQIVDSLDLEAHDVNVDAVVID
jgi:5-formyltetrahydrofolate cyclo-ligase